MTTSQMPIGAGKVTPGNDNAPGQGCVEGQERADNGDCAATDAQRKRIATAQARAALIGLLIEPTQGGAWRLTYGAFGSAGHVCTVPSLQAAEAALYTFEHARAEVLSMMDGLRHG